MICDKCEKLGSQTILLGFSSILCTNHRRKWHEYMQTDDFRSFYLEYMLIVDERHANLANGVFKTHLTEAYVANDKEIITLVEKWLSS